MDWDCTRFHHAWCWCSRQGPASEPCDACDALQAEYHQRQRQLPCWKPWDFPHKERADEGRDQDQPCKDPNHKLPALQSLAIFWPNKPLSPTRVAAHRLHMQGLQGRQLWGANPPLGEGRRGYPPHHTLPERPGWSHYQQHLWKRYGLHRRLGFSDLSSFIYHLVLRDLAWNTSHVLVSVRKARANTHRRNAINLPVQLWILPVRYHILNENCVSHKFSWCNKAV